MKTWHLVAWLFLGGLLVPLFVLVPASRAQTFDSVNLFFNAQYAQTGSGVSSSAFNYFFNAGAQTTGPDFTSVTFSDPLGGSCSSCPLTNFGGGTWGYAANYGSSLSAMNTAHPTGIYLFVGNPGASTSLNYSTQAFTSTIPALTSTSYNGLQGLGVSNPYTVNFNSFTQNSNANLSFLFFTVYLASTGAVVFTDGFLAPNIGSVIIPGGTLLAGTAYGFELNFDNRIVGPVELGATFPPPDWV
jgi:hypothetical protein